MQLENTAAASGTDRLQAAVLLPKRRHARFLDGEASDAQVLAVLLTEL
jgi:hypothetical protein